VKVILDGVAGSVLMLTEPAGEPLGRVPTVAVTVALGLPAVFGGENVTLATPVLLVEAVLDESVPAVVVKVTGTPGSVDGTVAVIVTGADPATKLVLLVATVGLPAKVMIDHIWNCGPV